MIEVFSLLTQDIILIEPDQKELVQSKWSVYVKINDFKSHLTIIKYQLTNFLIILQQIVHFKWISLNFDQFFNQMLTNEKKTMMCLVLLLLKRTQRVLLSEHNQCIRVFEGLFDHE